MGVFPGRVTLLPAGATRESKYFIVLKYKRKIKMITYDLLS
jgi:hypothetical protein